MSVSVAIITRDSEDVIGRCLESVKDADEIVVVDTGSETTATMDIARRYTDKVYTYYGCNEGGKKQGRIQNFSDARNHALKYCTMTHVLTIDSDEILEKGAMEVFRNFRRAALSMWCISEKTGEKHRQPRLYRNDPMIKWKRPIHNYIEVLGEIYDDHAIIYGVSKVQKSKDPDRSLRMLEAWCRKNPKDNTRELYYLAKEYHKRGWYKKAVMTFERYLKKSKRQDEKADAYMLLSRCYVACKRFADGVNAVMAAVNMNPSFKEALYLAGDLSGDVTRLKWHYLAERATNDGVMFVRANSKKKITILTHYDEHGIAYDFARRIMTETRGSVSVEAITNLDGNTNRKMTGPSVMRIGETIVKWRLQNSDIVHVVDVDKNLQDVHDDLRDMGFEGNLYYTHFDDIENINWRELYDQPGLLF
jgi:glycosyltransferase involved in cell wall biosynthesis